MSVTTEPASKTSKTGRILRRGLAVIGGLMCATVATLFFVPAVFSLLHRTRHLDQPEEQEAK